MKKNEQLVKYFKELYTIEKRARDLYNSFLLELTDEEVIKQVTRVRNDEEKHMDIVKDILLIVEKG